MVVRTLLFKLEHVVVDALVVLAYIVPIIGLLLDHRALAFNLGDGPFQIGNKLCICALYNRLFSSGLILVHVRKIEAIFFENLGGSALGQGLQLLDTFALRVREDLELLGLDEEVKFGDLADEPFEEETALFDKLRVLRTCNLQFVNFHVKSSLFRQERNENSGPPFDKVVSE